VWTERDDSEQVLERHEGLLEMLFERELSAMRKEKGIPNNVVEQHSVSTPSIWHDFYA
jgi:hypothetical protein